MSIHLYLSMTPESLVASMLPPEAFGNYLAVGTKKRMAGRAMFFDLEPDFRSDYFDLATVPERCTPHPDGQPKHSVYLGIYRVLEHVPLEVVNSLWLATRHGRVLELKPSDMPPEPPGKYYLYQEICPVHPAIASSLGPADFCRFITDPERPFNVPRICYADMRLSGWAEDPRGGRASDLPYAYLDHLRDCLLQLEEDAGKHTKTVDRIAPVEFPYRCIRSGFFLGDQGGLIYYPFPSPEELDRKHFQWWRSANA